MNIFGTNDEHRPVRLERLALYRWIIFRPVFGDQIWYCVFQLHIIEIWNMIFVGINYRAPKWMSEETYWLKKLANPIHHFQILEAYNIHLGRLQQGVLRPMTLKTRRSESLPTQYNSLLKNKTKMTHIGTADNYWENACYIKQQYW